ncbi:MAG TPA: DUF3795 domain-containing protein [Syntrophomonadaceae bacterium]|nr:DUF3795 domain-containing protein [Syntrophomonadaceae bacterium]
MDYSDIVKQLTPCGLDCRRCANFADGEIKKLSAKMIELLGNYERVAKMKAATQPEFEHYLEFFTILKSFSGASCSGCRFEETVKLMSCPIDCPLKNCSEKGVDFCFQCLDYPCANLANSGFGEWVRKRNDRMKEIGVDSYLEERLKVPRYP